MKLHDNNSSSYVVTSNDVFVNGNTKGNLTDVIDNQNEKLNNLEKNVKWIYKYGGTGSKGGSGGSGSSDTINLDCTVLFGNNLIKKNSEQKIICDKTSEKLTVSLLSANTLNVYKVTIQHGSNGSNIMDPSTGSKNWYLSSDNDYTISANIILDSQADIIVTITGENPYSGETKRATYVFMYLKNPYDIKLSLVDNTGKKILDDNDLGGGNLYNTDAINSGVKLQVNYNIASTKSIGYNIKQTEDILESYAGFINDGIDENGEHGIGSGFININFNNDFISNENSFGNHIITMTFRIDPDESLGIITAQTIVKTLSFAYIPNDRVFFKINPVNSQANIYKYSENTYSNAKDTIFVKYKKYYDYAKQLEKNILIELSPEDIEDLNIDIQDPPITQLKDIINNRLSELESELYVFNIGILQLYVQAYYKNDATSTTDVQYELTAPDGTITSAALIGSIEYRKRQIVNIPIHSEGVYKLAIYNQDQFDNHKDHIIYYYFAVFDKNSGINWFENGVSFNNVDLYYRSGEIGSNISNNHSLANYINKYKNIQHIQQYSSSETIELFDITSYVNSYVSQTDCDVMMSFGIQYSYINNSNNKILSLITNNNVSQLNIDIYQNKITKSGYSDAEANIFLPKEHNYSVGNLNNYHLLTIYKRYIYYTSVPHYEIIIYLDGCQEGAFKSFVKDANTWTKVLLHNSNFSINFFELSYFNHNKDNDLKRFYLDGTTNIPQSITYLDDIAISEYYYKFLSLYKNEEYSDKLNTVESILSNLRNFNETSYGMIEVASITDVNNIASNINIPVMLFDYSEDNEHAFVNWFTNEYQESSLSKVKYELEDLYYSSGNTSISKIIMPTLPNGSGLGKWYIALQGSSTGSFFSKNLTLGINSTTPGFMGIFTPNYYDVDGPFSSESDEIAIKAKNSFLPETAFTLKADVVDSSHSNNTAVGAFVNANTTKFDIQSDNDNKYAKYIKNCLLGFPVLCFARVTHKGESKIYYLGIYNFNLGRDSYFNMGYYNTSILNQEQINDTLLNLKGDTFAVTYVSFTNEDSSSLDVSSGVIVAEIQGGNPYFDFSQYDSTILLPQSSDDTECMFGDFVPKYNPANITNADKRIMYHIPRLVKGIAKAGGYIFDEILHKHLGEYSYRYNKYIDKGEGSSIFDSANQVPNYKIQYVRYPNQNDVDLKYLIKNLQKDDNDNIILDSTYFGNNLSVGYLIDDSADIETINLYGRGNKPILDYTSLTEYYVTCMAFGLVDSVMKNLNVKTWDATFQDGDTNDEINSKVGKWYVAFYDMDTSFGKDNEGKKTSYFAFSDYWKTSGSSTLEIPTIYRDFYPKTDPNNPYVENQSLKESGFDIPSSYLFAVAKYAHLLNDGGYTLKKSIPHNIWGRWRYTATSSLGEVSGSGTGELRSASYFIDKYFIRNLDDIPEQLWALNYRFKYLKRIQQDTTNSYKYTYDTGDNSTFNSRNFIPFHGKGINELYEWLNGRFHILDAYFNLDGSNLPIQKLIYRTKLEVNEFEPIIRHDKIEGYKYVDNQEPVSDSLGKYIWEDIDSTNIKEYIPDITPDTLSFNTDITILQDIFTIDNTGVSYSQPISLNIKSQEYSPFIIQNSLGGVTKYLIDSPDIIYNLRYTPDGIQKIKFGGSTLWTYIENVNTLVTNGFITLNSENLDQLILTRGICREYNISNMKSLKLIHIEKRDEDSKFSGQIIIQNVNGENPHPDLTVIELIKTEIILQIYDSGVKTINLNGTTSGGDTKILDCLNLTNVNLTNFSAHSLEINKGWSNVMNIKNTHIETLNIGPKDSNADYNVISINGDDKLSTLILNDFTHIEISNCPKLSNICITNPSKVVSLKIIGCNTRTGGAKLNIYNSINDMSEAISEAISEATEELRKLDLNEFKNLDVIKFTGTLGFTSIDLSGSEGEIHAINGTNYNCITLYPEAFKDTSLESIKLHKSSGSEDVYLYITSDNPDGKTETFNNSSYNGNNKIIIGSDVHACNYMFAHNLLNTTGSAEIGRDFVSRFLNGTDGVIFEDINQITSLEGIFYGQTQILSAIGISLAKFENVNNISYAFYGTSITSVNCEEFFGKDGKDNSVERYCGVNVIEHDGIFNMNACIPVTAQISENFFSYYINNVETLLSPIASISYNIQVNYTNSKLNIKKLFEPKSGSATARNTNRLKSFMGFNIHKDIPIDWTDLLVYKNGTEFVKRFPNLTSIYNSFNNENINSTKYDNIGLNKLDMSNLELTSSFNFSPKSIEKYDLFNIINFNTITSKNYPWQETRQSLNGAKYIDKSKIINLLTTLNTQKCKNISSLFANTDIYVNESESDADINKLKLSEENTPYGFLVCEKLFMNSRFIDKDNQKVYGYEITADTLKAFTNVYDWAEAFKNTTLHKNLPLNMFNLKHDDDSEYLAVNYEHKITNLTGMFENTVIDSNKTWFEYDWANGDIKYNGGIALNGSYKYKIHTLNGYEITNPETKDIEINTENNTKIYGQNIIKNLILPWDIFYACANGCLINKFIANSNFEGILPSLLFPAENGLNKLRPENTFENTLVIPNYVGSYLIKSKLINTEKSEDYIMPVKTYVFIPENFTATEYLSNGFNFKMLLPNSAAQNYQLPFNDQNNTIILPNNDNDDVNNVEQYFILQNESVNISVLQTIQNFLPNDYATSYYDEGNSVSVTISLHTNIANILKPTEIHDYRPREDYGIHYSIYLSAANKGRPIDANTENWNKVEDYWKTIVISDKLLNKKDYGLPLSGNTKLLYNQIFNRSIISFCYGAIISEYNLGNLNNIPTADYIMELSDWWADFCYNIILPLNNINETKYYEKIVNPVTYEWHLNTRNIIDGEQKSLEFYIKASHDTIKEEKNN